MPLNGGRNDKLWLHGALSFPYVAVSLIIVNNVKSKEGTLMPWKRPMPFQCSLKNLTAFALF